MVSTSDMPAVNNAGNTSTDQIGRPADPCVAEMPSRPISLAVSKPSPNRKPSGYKCQLRLTIPNNDRNIREINPLRDNSPCSASSVTSWPRLTAVNALAIATRMTMLSSAMTSRKPADTPVPITPPTCLNQSNLASSAPTESATSTEAMTTTVECPSAKKKPTAIGRLPGCISL